MPSFLNKVFGHKKHDDRPTREAADSTLLDGKYEAILSPSASTFAEAQPTKDPDVGFSLFRPRTRGVSQKPAQKHSGDVPHLTLQLPGPKENSDSRSLGVVFEADPDSLIVLDDAAIAAKRLDPLEALILTRACAQAITERGLETLGIMHPHWFSASPDVQRKLISLFIRSLTQSRITTLSPTPTSSTSAFQDELHYTRSPHDVAAVLRWGLRHLSLENGHFGKDSTEWGWYNAFSHAERNASYPPRGFSELLLPRLPPSHIELLTATLTLISSLAAHAEGNGISGSKLSKCLGLLLLVPTRAEQSDDWNRFYARWERAGRILEHLFLARLREESFGQRLPTRLQELVKHYPYNKGSPATDDDLLSRPRFSTRQYDALFVRVETLLTHSAEQPKQHPIQLLLEAFQLPIANPSGDEHIALWNILKTTAFEEATSSDPEGPQFTRIFVDETIHLLSSIPADNNVPTSPTLLNTPITKVVSRKHSSPLIKAFERVVSKSNADNGTTPVSPTSPSSIVVTDWAQFALSGFGETSTTQPLATLLSQDDDIEVTQPRISRKSSRQRGKSRSRRRRSEDREPSDSPPSAQPDLERSIVETKLASVHVVQIDEAFIDFWSDAIVDPISANWPTFVICGLKQVPSAEQPIRWLVIEQAYSRQQPRAPSPDGRRGRSPRPSFRSDISGFRINSMFSSARKRFSVFSKSATDLDPKKSGGKTPVAGELGEVLLEEELTFPYAPPTLVGHDVSGNAAVRATVNSGATADVADQLKADESSTVPIAGVPPADLAPALKEDSDPVQAAPKAPSVELTPQSGVGYNGPSVLPRSSVGASEEAVSVEQGSPQILDEVVDPKVNNLADPVTAIAPAAADTSDSRSTHGTCDPTVLASGPASSAENPVTEEAQIQAAQVRQGVAVEAEDQPVELVAEPANSDERDERLHAKSTGESSNVVWQVDVADIGSREDTEAVAMPPTPETVALVAATPVHDEAPKPIVEEPQVAKQPSRKASADPVAAFTVKSVGQHEIHCLSPVSASENTAIATGAQLEPHSVVDEVKRTEELAELAEIPTPAPEHVALVEETPGQGVSVDICGRAGTAQVPAAKPEALDGAALRLEALDESSVTDPVEAEAPSVEVVPAVDASAQVVAVETEHAADQVPELAIEEAQTHVQDTLVRAAEPLPAPEVEADVFAGIVSASQQAEDVASTEVEAQAAPASFVHEDRTAEGQDTGAPTPAPEHVALVDETPGPEIAAEASPERGPAVEAVMDATAPPSVSIPLDEEAQPSLEAELPTQVHDIEAAEALFTGSIPEAATAALATVDEATEAQSTPDTPTEDAEAHVPAQESAPVEDTPEIAAEGPSSTATDPEPIENKAAAPVTKEAQVFVEDAAPSASEPLATTPVAQDVQATIEIEQPPSESAPQSADEAASSPIIAAPVPEEIIAVEVQAQPEHQVVVYPTVDAVDGPHAQDAEPAPAAPELGVPVEAIQAIANVSEPETVAAETELVEVSATTPVVEDAHGPVKADESSPVAVEVPSEEVVASPPKAVETNDTTKVNEPQEVVDLAEQPVTSEIDASRHEPAGLSEEVVPTEP